MIVALVFYWEIFRKFYLPSAWLKYSEVLRLFFEELHSSELDMKKVTHYFPMQKRLLADVLQNRCS